MAFEDLDTAKTKHRFERVRGCVGVWCCRRCGLHRRLNPESTDKRKPYHYWWEGLSSSYKDTAGYCR